MDFLKMSIGLQCISFFLVLLRMFFPDSSRCMNLAFFLRKAQVFLNSSGPESDNSGTKGNAKKTLKIKDMFAEKFNNFY
jgi:hypothetical protein